jgi:transposase
MKKVARTLRAHRALLVNWFRAKGELSSGAVEGLNNKIRVVTRRSYGFRTYEAMEMASYQTLGKLPEPDESTHRFCRRGFISLLREYPNNCFRIHVSLH